jgi:hypothetical protein
MLPSARNNTERPPITSSNHAKIKLMTRPPSCKWVAKTFVFATASMPDTSLYSEPLELIWNDSPWIVETRCRRRFFTSSDGIDELTRDSLGKLGSSARLPKTQKNPLLLPWWSKVDRRFDSPIYLFGCEEHFRTRSHCPG